MNQGKKIETARKYRNLTQSELAKIVGVNQRTISSAEQGKLKKDPSYILRIAKALKILPEWFISYSDHRPIEQVDLNIIFKQQSLFSDVQMIWLPKIELNEIKGWLKGKLILQRERYKFMLNKNYSAKTFIITLSDDSMEDTSAYSLEKGAQIIIDPQAEVTLGKFILAKCNNKFFFRRLAQEGAEKILVPLNKFYEKIKFNEKSGDEIIGVAQQAFHVVELP